MRFSIDENAFYSRTSNSAQKSIRVIDSLEFNSYYS